MSDDAKPVETVPARRRGAVFVPMVLVVIALFLAAAAWVTASEAIAPVPVRPRTAQNPPTRTAAPAPRPQDGSAAMFRSDPTRIHIPDLGVDAPLIPVRLGSTGTLQPPASDDRNLAGWYDGGISPGEIGTALVVGHLDTRTGPAVFYRLSALTPGQTVALDRRDGQTAVFTIDAVEDYPKTDFPSSRVYQPATRSELRLITCAGPFDREHGGYQDNTVVYAHLTAIRCCHTDTAHPHGPTALTGLPAPAVATLGVTAGSRSPTLSASPVA
ncbi:class F sortase [Kitasatospora sp. NPDC085895]|uniref:class F sortase n=1 Tax=Kitasatospora sp. NPDC085895 TaxID=3155057 RepID=UPI003450D4F3